MRLRSRIKFGFFTEDEVRAMSVKQITTPHVFDNLGQAVPNGLYDLTMGTTEKFAK